VHPEYLPARGPEDSDADYFLTWQRWRRDNGLPTRVFASLDRVPLDPDAQAGEGVTFKPQYVDFDSFFSVGLLESAVRGANRLVVLEEMLPDAEHLWLRSPAGRYVTEQTIEITGSTMTAQRSLTRSGDQR
jgi:hypothetical protein